MVGLISGGDTDGGLKLTLWCSVNDVVLNVAKMQEVILDSTGDRPTPRLHDLSATANKTAILQRVHQQLKLLRVLRRILVVEKLLANFCHASIKMGLTYSQ